LRYLRAQKEFSQQQVANELIISRARYSKYEEGKSEPPLDIMLRISRYYQVSIDLMLSVYLRKAAADDLKPPGYGRGTNSNESDLLQHY